MPALLLIGGSIAASYLNGGIAWERLSWILGLRRLGFDVFVIDQLDRERCVWPAEIEPSYENCLNRGYFEKIVRRFGLGSSAALVGENRQVLYGPPYGELLELARCAEALVNVAGNVRLEELKRGPRVRIYVDVDPGLTQLWLASGQPAARLEGHDLHFTIGENVGTPASDLPSGGVDWRHTRQPVLLDEWPVSSGRDAGRFTTVAKWRGPGPHGRMDSIGLHFGDKADELRKVIELPRRVRQTFELALNIELSDREDRDALESYGWRLVDPAVDASDPESFRHYIQTSGAEFSVAKGAYAATASGWFSDRTTRYLASGKPALVQDTGFSRVIPTGEGLCVFRTLDEAVQGVERIHRDYTGHCEAARQIAETFFDSDLVLARFADEIADANRKLTRRRGSARTS
jgi:hypothetical protein